MSTIRRKNTPTEDKNKHKNIPSVFTRYPKNHNILQISKRLLPFLLLSHCLRQIISEEHIINSRRQLPDNTKFLTKAGEETMRAIKSRDSTILNMSYHNRNQINISRMEKN